jgi:Calcineurin-like phosphoesterase/Purple acid Phosphatase, N-terminal domain
MSPSKTRQETAREFLDWGPYLSFGVDSSTEVRISWESECLSTSRWICYGTTESCENLVLEDWVTPSRHHCIKLTRLVPDTTYYYKIARDDTSNKNVPGISLPKDAKDIKEIPIYTFKTGLAPGEQKGFDFCIMGDIHSGHRDVKPGFRSMVKNVPDVRFMVPVGDSIDNGMDVKSWNDYFYQTSEFMTGIPTMNATGNHDTGNPSKYAKFIRTWDHPYENPKSGAYYYFIYGNAAFICLDSSNAGYLGGFASDEQMGWLDETLEKLRKKNYWIFVFLHHQIYSTGDFGMPHMMHLTYRDIFDEYRVDGVFYGHDHHFECFWTGRDTEWGGTHYCVIGSGGSNLDTHIRNAHRKPTPPHYIWKDRTYIYERDGLLDGDLVKGVRNDEIVKKSHVFGILEHCFLYMHIEGDTCQMKTIGWQNQIYFEDSFKKTGTGKKYHRPKTITKFYISQ